MVLRPCVKRVPHCALKSPAIALKLVDVHWIDTGHILAADIRRIATQARCSRTGPPRGARIVDVDFVERRDIRHALRYGQRAGDDVLINGAWVCETT